MKLLTFTFVALIILMSCETQTPSKIYKECVEKNYSDTLTKEKKFEVLCDCVTRAGHPELCQTKTIKR